jgi:hypothetical protein
MTDGTFCVRLLMSPLTRRFPWLLFLALTVFSAVRAADVQKATFYVQLIRGSDADKPENPTWAPVGPKLDKNLRAVFRWKNYWEVKRETITVSSAKAARLHLTREREVELKLLDPPNVRIRLFNNGEMTRCSHQPIGEHMSILGGESKTGECWFVVVRRDNP